MPHSLLELCSGAEYSILFGRARPDDVESTSEPAYFRDLNLDRVSARLTGEADPYALAGLFRLTSRDLKTLALRQGVFTELRRPEVREVCGEFSTQMKRAVDSFEGVGRMHAAVHAQRWQLRAAEAYCTAVGGLVSSLAQARPTSEALRVAHNWLRSYRDAAPFRELEQESSALQDRLRRLRYDVFIHAEQVRIGCYADERAYEREVVETFGRFRPGSGDVVDPLPAQRGDYDPVRERIVEMVVKLQPDLFSELERFVVAHRSFFDPTVVLLYRELQFYLGYLDVIEPLEDSGLAFCGEPRADCDDFTAIDTFDLALALQGRAGSPQTAASHRDVVPNDIEMSPDDRRLVITGPNQGGKTTLARAVGQLHHLVGLGCPAPGREVRLRVPDEIFTHFDQAEVVSTSGSKLGEDLRSIAHILERVTPNSLVILNETFSSTTAADARDLGELVLERLDRIGCRCVFVTFIDELSRLDEHTVSMVSTVAEDDPTERTFRLVRRRADGRAYAASLAAKYHLTYEDLTTRLRA